MIILCSVLNSSRSVETITEKWRQRRKASNTTIRIHLWCYIQARERDRKIFHYKSSGHSFRSIYLTNRAQGEKVKTKLENLTSKSRDSRRSILKTPSWKGNGLGIRIWYASVLRNYINGFQIIKNSWMQDKTCAHKNTKILLQIYLIKKSLQRRPELGWAIS